MAGSDAIFVGIKGTVAAIGPATGETIWTTELIGSEFVNVTLEGGDLFAASRGRLYRLDAATGDSKWCNELPGLGYGLVTIAGTSQSGVAAAERRGDAAAASA